MCTIDATIKIRLGDDFFNRPETPDICLILITDPKSSQFQYLYTSESVTSAALVQKNLKTHNRFPLQGVHPKTKPRCMASLMALHVLIQCT